MTTQVSKSMELLYGRDGMSVSLPDDALVLEGQTIPALPDPAKAMSAALAAPIGSPPLAQLIGQRKPKAVAITISDITRPVPNQIIVPAILAELNVAGVADEQVVIIVGTGMHRPSTDQEKLEMLGADVLRRCEVIDHHGEDADTLVAVSEAPPVSLNKRFVAADFRVVTGLIEPHFMAGFSGGRKGVCPALADMGTVQRFHCYEMIGHAKTDTLVLEGNPCHAESLRVAKLAGVDFLVNAAVDRLRRPAGIYCGDMEQAHRAGCEQVGMWNAVTIDEPVDLLITNGGGYPLDQTFYQSVKGMVTPMHAMHEQTTVLIVSHCGEGIGSPQYTDIMARWGKDWRGFLKHIASTDEVIKDQWQYQMQARVLARIGVERLRFVCDCLEPDVQQGLAVNPVLGAGDACERAQRFIDLFIDKHPDARIGVIPEGPYVLPVSE